METKKSQRKKIKIFLINRLFCSAFTASSTTTITTTLTTTVITTAAMSTLMCWHYKKTVSKYNNYSIYSFYKFKCCDKLKIQRNFYHQYIIYIGNFNQRCLQSNQYFNYFKTKLILDYCKRLLYFKNFKFFMINNEKYCKCNYRNGRRLIFINIWLQNNCNIILCSSCKQNIQIIQNIALKIKNDIQRILLYRNIIKFLQNINIPVVMKFVITKIYNKVTKTLSIQYRKRLKIRSTTVKNQIETFTGNAKQINTNQICLFSNLNTKETTSAAVSAASKAINRLKNISNELNIKFIFSFQSFLIKLFFYFFINFSSFTSLLHFPALIKKLNNIRLLQLLYLYSLISAVNSNNNDNDIRKKEKIWHTISEKNYQKRFSKSQEHQNHYQIQQQQQHHHKQDMFLQRHRQQQNIDYFTTQSFFGRKFFE